MNLLICPNTYKSALGAPHAAAAIHRGLSASFAPDQLRCLPIADGGDGTLEVAAACLDCELRTAIVTGPLGQPVTARYGWNASAHTAVIELAEASGIRLLKPDQLNPWQATTYGTGELLALVVRAGAQQVYLTVGGSATVDGALGILDALGAQLTTAQGPLNHPLPSGLTQLTHINLAPAHDLLQYTRLYILCDVDNPLLGAKGAAAVFGPQKGARRDDLPKLEAGLQRLADVVAAATGIAAHGVPRAGAAGGVAGILHAALGAELLDGAEFLLSRSGFSEALTWSDVVITGEGCIDAQTAYGKGPGAVAKLAQASGKLVIGLSGYVQPGDRDYPYFDVVLPISAGPGGLAEAIALTASNLERIAYQLGKLLAKQAVR